MDIQTAVALLEASSARAAGEVERLSFQGASVEVIVGGQETGGAWSLLFHTAPAQFSGLAAHLHRETTETLYLVSGGLRVRIDGQEWEVGVGEAVEILPGLVHSFCNPYDVPSRVLIHCSPGGFEGYLRDVARLVARAPTWPPIDLRALELPAECYDTFCSSPATA